MAYSYINREPALFFIFSPFICIIENGSYHKLLLVYKELLLKDTLEEQDCALDNATIGYGIGNWFYLNGEIEKAYDIFRKIIKGDQWAAFVYIAAEAELSR